MKKSRNLQATKGNLKISSFFTKLNKPTGKEIPSNILNGEKVKQLCNNIPNKIVVDSDDDFIDVPDDDKRNGNRKCMLVTEPSSSKDIRSSTSPIIKKRRLKDSNTHFPSQKKKNVVIERELSPNCQPSTSECDSGSTPPSKESCGQMVFVKSPEKLLSPAALKEYHTPEKQLERFLERIRTPTPKKLLFNEASAVGSIIKSNDTFLSVVHNLRKTKKPIKVSPEKNTYRVPKSNVECEVQSEETPNKSKRTPKKLYDKSPKNLSEFNVQIIKDFVKITPSKSNKKDSGIECGRSSEKKQSSILKYISPAASARSAEAQRCNESTPTKQSPTPSISQTEQTPKSKVKAKLDFSDCNMVKASSSYKTESPKIASQSLLKEGRIKSPNNKSVTPPKHNSRNKNKEQENDFNLINVELNFDEDWHEEMLIPSQTEYILDLTESQHCKVIGVNSSLTKTVITLKSTKNGEQAICNLEGFWIHTQLSVGDTVHASAKKLNQRDWIINNEHGLLVYEPDLLVSTTSVVNTLWCKRRSVLSERFRGFEPSNQQMLVGTLVHSLLQQALKNRNTTQKEIENIAKNLVKQRSIILSLYECGLKIDVIEGELMKFVPKIVNFMKLYVRNPICNENSNLRPNKDDWKGTIETIEDIEENIWCPELGIKGKVDVSIKTDRNMMPLELKTGRASVSLEHRGQVMMYIMMMNKLGYNVPSGLLLYLREGVLREVPPSQKESRDIVMLRNELAHYLTRKPKIVEDEFGKKLFPPDLPEPINHPSCAKCPYNVICSSYAKYNNEDISSKKTLKNIQDEVFFYLEDSHLNYLMHWISLTALESNSTKGTKDLREIYTLTPKDRENNGKCIINLKVTNVEEECNGVIEHTFEKINYQPGVNFFANGIMESNYVVVSVSDRPAISAGFVTNITANSITVTLDRNLNKKYASRTFYIDSYDSSSIQSYNLASLMLLFELSPRAEQLRRIIIDKLQPTFKPTLPKLVGTKGKQILRRLNIVQQRAVLKAIAAREYFLIKGMPGTGKTATIVALIQLLVELNKSVLITSHTHSAVDNVCLRLVNYGVKLLRLGSESRIHPSLKEYSEHSLTKNCTTPEQLEAVYSDAQVLAVTCLGSGHPVLSKRTMDICIVDESTQVVQSSIIRPLYAAKTFILIGDPDQLPAVIKDKTAIEMGMSESLFGRLYTKEATIALNLNYRMNATITALANYLTYNGELSIGNDSVANATLKLPNREVLASTYKDCHWIIQTLDESLENAVQFLDTGLVWKLQHNVSWLINRKNDERCSENQNCVNIYEASVVVHIVEALIKAGAPSTEIGVIATYRAQVAQISDLLRADNVDVSTVDQFQGKDKNVIIYSCTRSRDISAMKMDNKFELLEDKRRLTVALTRAKHKLIVIGDFATLKQYSTFSKLMPCVEKNLIKLEETRNFDWERVLV